MVRVGMVSCKCSRQPIEATTCLAYLLCHSARCPEDWSLAPDHRHHLAGIQQLSVTILLWGPASAEAQFFNSKELGEPQGLQSVLQCPVGDSRHSCCKHALQCGNACHPVVGKTWLWHSILDRRWCSLSWWWDSTASQSLCVSGPWRILVRRTKTECWICKGFWKLGEILWAFWCYIQGRLPTLQLNSMMISTILVRLTLGVALKAFNYCGKYRQFISEKPRQKVYT